MPLVDAPNNGMFYARQSSSWNQIPIQSDVPSNNYYHFRRNGAWVQYSQQLPVSPPNSNITNYFVYHSGAWYDIGSAPPNTLPMPLVTSNYQCVQNGSWVNIDNVFLSDVLDTNLYIRTQNSWEQLNVSIVGGTQYLSDVQ
jgi:hypothetical protein